MVPDKFNMVDMGGIDLIMMQGEEVPGLYDRLVESITQCRYQCLYNWLFDGIQIPPMFVHMEIDTETGNVKINEGIDVTDESVIHIYSLEIPPIPPVLDSLYVDENGEYYPPSGVDGYNYVNVDIPSISGFFEGEGIPDDSIGEEGNIYKRIFPLPEKNFVSYLKNISGSYIITDIYANQDIDAIVEGDRSSGNTNACVMLGVRSGSFSSMTRALYFGSHTDNSGGISVIKCGLTGHEGTVVNKTGESVRRTYTITDTNGYHVYYATIDGVNYSKLFRETGDWTSIMPLGIFAYYQGTSLITATATAMIKRITIFDKHIPIADYIPCLDDNDTPCFWDNISKEFVYQTAGDGFIAGDPTQPYVLEPICYIKHNNHWQLLDERSLI